MEGLTSFGEWLRRRRQALDLTQDALAQLVGCAAMTIRKIEAGELMPSRQIAEQLADCLAIQPPDRAGFLDAARAEPPADRLAPSGRAAPGAAPSLPSGTVTFLFTDIEGSTARWERYPEEMRRALARHDAIMREVIEANCGAIFKMVGDGCHAVFTTAPDALAAALAAQHALFAEPWGQLGLPPGKPLLARMAIHTGAAELRDGDYFGQALNRIARLSAAGHGGQILLSAAAWELARDHLPPAVELRDLGEHYLKDLIRPEHIFQLTAANLPATFPPLKTLNQRPNNLPVQPTPLIGRERETAEVCALLRRPDVRLLTLTGTGGTGKTRLALQAAAELLEDFRDGVWLVTLASIADPDLVLTAIAQVLAKQEAGDPRSIARLGMQDAGEPPLLTRLKSYLREKQALLLLDNFEQVADAAPLVAELLSAAPGLKALVTSRVVLHVSGERELSVPPLDLPDPRHTWAERLSQYESVRLFIERSQAVKPDFAVTNENAPAVAEICVRLDGLPLAIELAAVRSKLFSPQALLARLDNRLTFLTGGARDLATRQRTLRTAIDWSYDLLSPAEQQLFAWLGVFVGGCTLEAAETVCGDKETRRQGDRAAPSGTSPGLPLSLSVLDGLSSLVDKSLLKQTQGDDGEPRFEMLETLREYALDRLVRRGEVDALRDAHAAYYLGLAEAAAQGSLSSARLAWHARLDAEHDNLRAALAWCQSCGDAGRELRLGAALWRYWTVRRHVAEGRGLLDDALARDTVARPTRARADALLGAGVLAAIQGDQQSALMRVQQSVALWRELGDRRGLAYALADGGSILAARDRVALLEIAQESLALFRTVGDQWGLAVALYNLGNAAALQGDYARMRALTEEGLALFRKANDLSGVSWGLSMLAYVSSQRGDNQVASALFQESLALSRNLRDTEGITSALVGLGWVAWLLGDADQLIAVFGEGLALAEEIGHSWGAAWAHNRLGWAAWMQGDLNRAAALLDQSKSAFVGLDSGNGLAWAFAGQAYVAWSRDDLRRAADLLMRGLGLFRIDGYNLDIAFALNSLGAVARARGDMARACELFGESLALASQQNDRWNLAVALEGVAGLSAARGRLDLAARLYAAADALRQAITAPLWAALCPAQERALADLRAQLGATAFEDAWAHGRAQPIAQLVREALELVQKV
ncbi:MAG: helix-turn-helix domain-containing protein [Kouleothrix sp.]|nr:helix-turn-helix domain-containing protein [Kouleothrix sp.]